MYRGERNLISIPGAYSPEVSTLKFMGKWQHELVDPVPSGLFWNQLIASLRTLLYVGTDEPSCNFYSFIQETASSS